MHCRIKIKILDERIGTIFDMPHYATNGSAGLDLRACVHESVVINPLESVLIGSGIAIHICDQQLAGIILPRSGLGHKHGLILGNSVGLIDSDYQGEIKISCLNRSSVPYTINPGDRVAQLVIIPVLQACFEVTDDFTNTVRGNDGFGSSGIY